MSEAVRWSRKNRACHIYYDPRKSCLTSRFEYQLESFQQKLLASNWGQNDFVIVHPILRLRSEDKMMENCLNIVLNINITKVIKSGTTDLIFENILLFFQNDLSFLWKRAISSSCVRCNNNFWSFSIKNSCLQQNKNEKSTTNNENIFF